MGHTYWGKVDEDWAGFSSEYTFQINHFKNTEIEVFLGEEYDDDGDKIDTPPTDSSLDEYQNTFTGFLNDIEEVVSEIKIKTFERYLKLYAHYYENEAKSGEAPLNIDNAEKHFGYIDMIKHIRVLDNGILKIPMDYDLDPEHGLEIKIQNNKVIAIGGIADT